MSKDPISIIIPTLNESEYIDQTLQSLARAGFNGEIIIVDANSADETLLKVRKNANVRAIMAPRANRGFQMNLGAEIAQANYLFFLHADSVFPKEGMQVLRSRFQHQDIIAGSFSLKFDKTTFLYRILSRFSRINHALFTYGDQGLLVRKDVFEELGGFAELPILEDLDLIQRIRKYYRFEKLPLSITTSTRRFEKNGPVRQTIINIAIVIGYCLGLSPQLLKQWYF